MPLFHQKQPHVRGSECNTRLWEEDSEIAKNLMLLVPVHLGRSLSGALGVGFLFSLCCRGAQTQTYFFKRVEKMAAALPRELQNINTHITLFQTAILQYAYNIEYLALNAFCALSLSLSLSLSIYIYIYVWVSVRVWNNCKVSYSHQGYIYLIKNWNIMKCYYNLNTWFILKYIF